MKHNPHILTQNKAAAKRTLSRTIWYGERALEPITQLCTKNISGIATPEAGKQADVVWEL